MEIDFPLFVKMGEIPCHLLHINLTSLSASRETKVYHQHSHVESCELHYCIRGFSTLISEQDRLTMQAGSVALIPPSVYHQFGDDSSDLEKMSLIFSINPEHNTTDSEESVQFETVMKQTPICLIEPETPLNRELLYVLESLCQLVVNSKNWTFTNIERLRALFAILLIDLYTAMSKNMVVQRDSRKSAFVSRSYTIDEYFSIHHSEGNLSQLAKVLNISERQTNRIIWQTYGMSFRDKLNEVRLKNAMDFLTTSKKTLAEISELLGYSSPANFSAFIKRETGKTPSQIRADGNVKTIDETFLVKKSDKFYKTIGKTSES